MASSLEDSLALPRAPVTGEGCSVPVITLTTDFGMGDGYVGTMKGVILSLAPQAQIVDISHDIEPANVRQAAYVLATAAPFFPAGTVHVAVVDPGVGSARRPIVVRTQRAFYVGPDNGVLSYALLLGDDGLPGGVGVPEPAGQRWAEARVPEGGRRAGQTPVSVVHLDRPEYWLPTVSRTFHGRDIFSPIAARLATGQRFEELGSQIDDAVTLPLPQPEQLADGSIHGVVLHADRFGNLITDIPGRWLETAPAWEFVIGGRTIRGLIATYACVPEGHLLALTGSEGLVEIAVREGSAAEALGAGPGSLVVARPGPDGAGEAQSEPGCGG